MNTLLKWLIAGTILTGIILAGFVIWTVRSQSTPQTTPSQNQGNIPDPSNSTSIPSATVPVGTPQGPSVRDRQGNIVPVKDFIHNGETASDTVNPGGYYMAGSSGYCLANGVCPSGASTTDFTVSYKNTNDLFTIVLTKEPLGVARAHAEKFLADRLGLSEIKLCTLNYWIGTTYWINQAYAGKNLGFSFCPGAEPL